MPELAARLSGRVLVRIPEAQRSGELNGIFDLVSGDWYEGRKLFEVACSRVARL